jgi:hypothetical protein
MIKLFLKYLFSLGLLLLLGNQQLYAYGLNTSKTSVDKTSSSEDFDGVEELSSNSFSSDQRQRPIIGEEKVEEEEERTVKSDDIFENDYLATSFAHTFSALNVLLLSKEPLASHPYFSYLTSYKRYLHFEVFRI